jgi:hypothetical protein
MHCLTDSLVAGAHHLRLLMILSLDAITAISKLWRIVGDNAADMLLWCGWVIDSWQIVGSSNAASSAVCIAQPLVMLSSTPDGFMALL